MKIKKICNLLLSLTTLSVLTPLISNFVNKTNSSQINNSLKSSNDNSSKTLVNYSLVETRYTCIHCSNSN